MFSSCRNLSYYRRSSSTNWNFRFKCAKVLDGHQNEGDRLPDKIQFEMNNLTDVTVYAPTSIRIIQVVWLLTNLKNWKHCFVELSFQERSSAAPPKSKRDKTFFVKLTFSNAFLETADRSYVLFPKNVFSSVSISSSVCIFHQASPTTFPITNTCHVKWQIVVAADQNWKHFLVLPQGTRICSRG